MSETIFSGEPELQRIFSFYKNELAQKPGLQVLESLVSCCSGPGKQPRGKEKKESCLSRLFLRLMDTHALASKDELDRFVFHRMYPLDPPTQIWHC